LSVETIELEGRELLEKLLVPYEKYDYPLPSTDELMVKLYMEKELLLYVKPSGYIIKPSHIEVALAGIWAKAPFYILGKDPDEVILTLSTYNKWYLRVVANEVRVVKVERLLKEPAMDIAERILEEVIPFEALVIGMGYKLSKDITWYLIPRLLPLIHHKIHIFQMTNVESGKTFFATYLMRWFRWGYITAPPTEAGLWYDASKNAFGLAVISDGLVFDEIEKWPPEAVTKEGINTYLPTFLEQGLVVRPVSRRFPVNIERKIPTIWFGNCREYMGGDEIEIALNLFESWNCKSAVDRIAIIHIDRNNPRILDYVTWKILPPEIMIAIVKIAKESLNEAPAKSKLSGRKRMQSIWVQRALYALGITADPEIIDYAVENGWDSTRRMYGGVEK